MSAACSPQGSDAIKSASVTYAPAPPSLRSSRISIGSVSESPSDDTTRYDVLPLLAPFPVWMGDLPPQPTIYRHRFAGDIQHIQTPMIPRIYGRSYSIETHVNVPDGGAEGVLRTRR